MKEFYAMKYLVMKELLLSYSEINTMDFLELQNLYDIICQMKKC